MHTNIGLLFLETHRWVEALDSFQEAQRRMPRNAIAAFQEMRQLMHLAGIFGQDERTYQSYCHLDALCQRVGNLARIVENNYDIVSEFSGAAALPIVRRAVERASNFEGGPDDPLSNSYFAFVRRYDLALSVRCSTEEFERGRFDLLSIPSIQAEADDGFEVPEIFAMLNVMKTDFAFARQLFYQSRDDDTPSPYFETASRYDTLDYSLYGVCYSALTTAQRISFDLLDKVAVAIASYMKLPRARKASFLGIWGKDQKGSGFVLAKEIEDELLAGNKPLLALYEIYQDISKHERLGEGFMTAQKEFRNSSTHRFTVLHDMDRNRTPKLSIGAG